MIGDEKGNHVFQIYAIDIAKDKIASYIKSMFDVNSLSDSDPSPWYDYHSLKKGCVVPLETKRTQLMVEVFECDHTIPTIGYGFTEIKHKLKEEYSKLTGKDIGKLRKEGVEITEPKAIKKFTYICDTSIDVFNLNPSILEYPVIFIECTFILDEELENAGKTKHIHWKELKPYVENNPDKTFILFHFSQRYRNSEISEFFEKEKESGIDNIIWW